MTAPYNLTNITGANNFVDLMVGTSSNLMSDSLGTLIVLAVFVIFFFGFKQVEFKKAFAASAWITALLSLFLSLLGLLSTSILVAVVVIASLSAGLLILKND